MNKSLLFILALTLLSACGQKDDVLRLGQFKAIVKQFEYEGKLRHRNVAVTDLIVEFDSIEGSVIGRCYLTVGMTPKIVIDREYWDRETETLRELLMFHELGHCVLLKDHVSTNYEVMSPYILSEDYYVDNRDSLLDTLFRR